MFNHFFYLLSLNSSKQIKFSLFQTYIKNLVWHSHNFLLPYITVEEYFINSIAFKFNLHFICFVVHELPGYIVIVYNF